GGAGRGVIAGMLFLGALGLAPHAHEMLTDTALLAGFALAFLGLIWALERPLRAGALLGTGVGMGFMSKGLVEPAMMGIACLLLPAAFRAWRTRNYAIALAWGALFALPWLAIWPAALYARDPVLFHDWFWLNNLGRYFGFAELGADDEPWYYSRTLPWFTLPSGAVAAWAVWRAWRERTVADARDIQLCVAVAAAIIAVLGTASTVRSFYAMPLLVPLAVAGSRVALKVQRAGLGAAAVFGIAALGVSVFCWAVWGWAIATGEVPPVTLLQRWLPPRFHLPFEPLSFAAAAFLTALWLWCWRRWRHLPWTHLWLANVCVVWGVTMTLLMPWIDNARSFRAPFSEIAGRVEPGMCVQSRGLGEPQRGMLDYVAGLKTVPAPADEDRCAYLLMQASHSGARPPLPPGAWRLLWEGARPGEDRERFSLWRAVDEGVQLAKRGRDIARAVGVP
ncbi:MAG TPA: hypothetical protein VFP36_00120, partial [Usitatibacter sp.]|nr:hypothetical protein [Usitatibacter sp.]